MFSLIKSVKFKTRIKFRKFECHKLYEMQKFIRNTQYFLQFMTFCHLYAYLFEIRQTSACATIYDMLDKDEYNSNLYLLSITR